MRRIVSGVVSLVLVAGLAGCHKGQAAASVNGQEVTVGQLEDDVALMRDHPDLAAAFNLSVPPEGKAVPAAVTAQLLTLRIAEIILADSYAGGDKKLTEAEEAEQRSAITQQLVQALGSQQAVDSLPKAFVTRLLDRFVHSKGVLGDIPEDQFNDTVATLFGGFRVTVDPRFGTWDPTALEVVPDAPPAVGGGSSAQLVEQ